MKNNMPRIVDSMAWLASRLELMACCTFVSPVLTSAAMEADDTSFNSVSNADN
jgi:hypothetical protein